MIKKQIIWLVLLVFVVIMIIIATGCNNSNSNTQTRYVEGYGNKTIKPYYE